MRSWHVWVLGALVLAGGVCALAGTLDPGAGRSATIVPAGLVTGAVLRAPARLRPAVVVLAGLVCAGSALAAGFTAAPALGTGVTAACEAVTASVVLLRGRTGPPALITDLDLRRYLLSCSTAAVVGGLVVLTISTLADFPAPAALALAVGMASLASLLVIVPIFIRLPDHDAVSDRLEHTLQWVMVLVVTPVVVFGSQQPSMLFLVVPLLAWGAFRVRPAETMAQLIGVFALVVLVTASHQGPFTLVEGDSAVSSLRGGTVLSAFAGTCAVIVVPLMLRLGEYVALARAAAHERDLVRSIVDGATGVAIIGSDPRGRVTLFNPGAERLLGYRADEVLGRPALMLHSPASITAKSAELGVADTITDVAERLVDGHHVGAHVRYRRRDGVERTHAVTLTLLRDRDGVPSGYLSTSEDVTDELERKRALQIALDVERRAVERLREADAVKDAVLSTVSHELRTPITSILGYLEMLSDGSYGSLLSSQRDAVLRVSTNSERLLGLIDNLLTLSRIDDSRDFVGTDFDLRAAVDAAYGLVAPAWTDGRTLDVTWSRPDHAVPVHGDQEMLERVVVNLLGNAVKFTPDHGSVRLDLGLERGDVVLEVSDTGIGIPPEEHDQLFTRFFRSSLAQGQAIPGSGLGLAISKAIVEQHGGSIAVRSDVGRGTSMLVRLPVPG